MRYPRAQILEEVDAELIRQNEKWGEQNHPLIGADRDPSIARSFYLAAEAEAKADNDLDVGMGTLGWDGILLEEVYEALAEADPEKAEAELIQVAAVAVQAVLSLRRQRGAA